LPEIKTKKYIGTQIHPVRCSLSNRVNADF
jgi:hypothetical protein